MKQNDKAYQVIIASEANNRMYEHFEFLARVSMQAANRLLDGFIKDLQNLRTDPFRYPVYNRPYLPVGKYRCLLSNRRYRIVYQIIDSFVYVDDIQDCRQDDNKSILGE